MTLSQLEFSEAHIDQEWDRLKYGPRTIAEEEEGIDDH